MKSDITNLNNKYLDLLSRWNKIHNLTALETKEQMNKVLVQPSLVLEPWLCGRIADIGTGAGIPGIPLAIARADLQFTLIDSRIKKTSFIEQAIQFLGLSNVTALHQRIEDCHIEPFDTIVSRALGSIAYIDKITKRIRHSNTKLLLIRGRFDETELFGQQLQMLECLPLCPSKQHNLVIMSQ